MFTIPLYTFIFIYLAFLAVFVIFSIINFYHIITSGAFTIVSFGISFLVFTLTALTLYFTWVLLADVDWQHTIVLFNAEWIPNIFKI